MTIVSFHCSMRCVADVDVVTPRRRCVLLPILSGLLKTATFDAASASKLTAGTIALDAQTSSRQQDHCSPGRREPIRSKRKLTDGRQQDTIITVRRYSYTFNGCKSDAGLQYDVSEALAWFIVQFLESTIWQVNFSSTIFGEFYVT